MHLYIATTNPGKLRDFAHAASTNATLEPLPNLNTIPAPPEDAPTFEANARTKAIYYSQHAPNLLVLADDSGLEVTCLNNAPGVRSARYADDMPSPAFRNSARGCDDKDARETTPPSSEPSTASPKTAARPATAAPSPSPATAKSSQPPKAPSKARSSPPPAAPTASATTRSSSSPTSTKPWPK